MLQRRRRLACELALGLSLASAPAAAQEPSSPRPERLPPPLPVAGNPPLAPKEVLEPPPEPTFEPGGTSSVNTIDMWLRLSGGGVVTEGAENGGFGRFEVNLSAAEPRYRDGFIGGSRIGVEGWGSPDGGGGSATFSQYVGFRGPPLCSMLGIGVDPILYDQIHHDGGFGIFAPLATAAVGLELPYLRILADARAQYRWQWGAPDPWQIKLGVTVSLRVTD